MQTPLRIIIIKELLITIAPFLHCKHSLYWANYLICINWVEKLKRYPDETFSTTWPVQSAILPIFISKLFLPLILGG